MTYAIIIYTSQQCPYCIRAKSLFDLKGVKYEEIRVDLEPGKRDEMIEKSGRRTVPQIFINDKHIGGFDDLYDLELSGELDILLKKEE